LLVGVADQLFTPLVVGLAVVGLEALERHMDLDFRV